MSITLYVFSTTGNCLTTARKLAAHFKDCNIVNIASVKNKSKIKESTDTIGFIFPIYYGDMPYPVRETISKMIFQDHPYIFAFTTCRGHVGLAPQRLDILLQTRGQKLSLALNMKMPGNSFLNTLEMDQKCLSEQEQTLLELLPYIKNKEIKEYTTQDILPLTPVDYPNNFRGIMSDDTCIGCGTCVKVCPMKNISISEGKAIMGDECATCLACFHWCPVEAVFMSKQEDIARRRKYHHPEVTLDDFIL